MQHFTGKFGIVLGEQFECVTISELFVGMITDYASRNVMQFAMNAYNTLQISKYYFLQNNRRCDDKNKNLLGFEVEFHIER